MERTLRIGGRLALFGAGLGVAYWQLQGRFNSGPRYVVEERSGSFEIRRYAPIIRAETAIVSTDWNDALQTGFERLAHYISGGNSGEQHITMTSPVTQTAERVAAETALATTEHAGANPSWLMSFTMPANRSFSSLPVPHDPRVRLRPFPERRLAVLRFSGRYTSLRVGDKARELLDRLEAEGLEPSSAVEFAGYDPPTTLPFLRRNEVWVELAA